MKTAEEMLKDKSLGMITVPKDSTIHEAIKIMNENKIGAILVKDGEDIVGIWTERDLLRNSMDDAFDRKTAKISDYMSTELKFVQHNETVYQLHDKFLGMRLRHLLVEKGGKYIGMISTGDVMKTVLNEKEKELKALNAMTSWEYYDNWRWSKKK
ncbi:MAG: CBS domain-containing protein [Ignavibacteria bacterium]|jgi:CBS domain-containing protein